MMIFFFLLRSPFFSTSEGFFFLPFWTSSRLPTNPSPARRHAFNLIAAHVNSPPSHPRFFPRFPAALFVCKPARRWLCYNVAPPSKFPTASWGPFSCPRKIETQFEITLVGDISLFPLLFDRSNHQCFSRPLFFPRLFRTVSKAVFCFFPLLALSQWLSTWSSACGRVAPAHARGEPNVSPICRTICGSTLFLIILPCSWIILVPFVDPILFGVVVPVLLTPDSPHDLCLLPRWFPTPNLFLWLFGGVAVFASPSQPRPMGCGQ